MRHSPAHTYAVSLLAVVLAATALAPAPVSAQVHQSERHAFTVDTLVNGLQHPWGMRFLPNGDVLVTEKAGRLRWVRIDDAGGATLVAEPIAGVPEVWDRRQGGLLDVELHPDFARNRVVYLAYSKEGRGGITTALARGTLDLDHPDGPRLTGVQDIFVADARTRSGAHFGSRLAFDRDGYLFMTIGDRGRMEEAQDRSDHKGVTLRLRDDGSAPDDNPFVGEAGVRPEIWTWGNRSPQGLAFDPETGELWQNEHGPQGGDELNRILPGRNYGWPTITYGRNYDDSIITEDTARHGMEQPVHYWVPSIATSGLAIYRGDRFPEWNGDALVGGLRGSQLARVDLEDGRAVDWETMLPGYSRVRDVRLGPDGYVYLLLDERESPLVRLRPAE